MAALDRDDHDVERRQRPFELDPRASPRSRKVGRARILRDDAFVPGGARADERSLDRRLSEAYGQTNFFKARAGLENTVRWLHRHSPDAAASLEEGLAETLTVVRLRVPRRCAAP